MHATGSSWRHTTRLSKGGALLDEMRLLVRSCSDAPSGELRDSVVRSNLLSRNTRARAADVYSRVFVPRFVRGPISEAWRLVKPLEDVAAPVHVVRPVYFWLTARADSLLGDFCREYVLENQDALRVGVSTADVVGWLERKGSPWSPTVSVKVARGLLAALRDFGVLEGRQQKRLRPHRPSLSAFSYVAFCLRQLGAGTRSILAHADWELLLLRPADVEHLLLLAHQEKLLEFQVAGSTASLSFPTDSIREYAQLVAQGSI